MRRFALLLSLGCLACTRPNPAFDGLADGTSGDGDGDTTKSTTSSNGDGDGDPSGDGDGEPGTSESTGDGDGEPPTDFPPDNLCPWQPSPGLALILGNPTNFGGQCPTGIDATVRVEEAIGGAASLGVCNEDCSECAEGLKLSAFPLSVTNYMPTDADECLVVSAKGSLGGDANGCYWGALSVHDAFSEVPYVIATAHSAPPTPYGQDILAGIIPQPKLAGGCNCEEVGQANDCCYVAEPPEFYYYPFNGFDLFGGDYAEFDLANFPLGYFFKVFQAERVPSCEGDSLQLSWAVTAALP